MRGCQSEGGEELTSARSMSDFSPGLPPAGTPPTASTAASLLASVYPAGPSHAAGPAVSPTRRRATSVPAQREADTASLSASPTASPSPSPPAAGSLAAPLTALAVQPPTPVATLSYQPHAHHQQSDHVPTLATARVRAPPPPPLPLSLFESAARPSAPPLFPRTPPPSQPSAGAVRLLLPFAAANPFASLIPSPSTQAVYHQQRLFGRQRHRVVQGELLQMYLVVPHTQNVLFPWLFASASPPPPPSVSSQPPSPPVLVTDISPCRFHVDVRLRAASVRTEDNRDDTEPAFAPPSSAVTVASGPSTAAVPQPPTSLSLSSAGSLASSTEPSSATSGWSRFTTRFGRKSGASIEKDNGTSSAATAATNSSSTSSSVAATTGPMSSSLTQVQLILPVGVQSAPSPLLSPQSAPVSLDGLGMIRPEPRRSRSLGLLSPSHIPPHIVVAPHSAFQHEPPFHLLPHRPTSLTCSPALHHPNSTTGSGCYQFTLSNGDVVLVMETIMHASADGYVWLEVEVHSPASHQSLLSSLSLPAVSMPASNSSSTLAASLRSFMSDHRVLRLPPPHPLAGCLLHISHAVHVHASVQQANDCVFVEVRVIAHDDVRVESVELLTESARWLTGSVSLPVPLSSLFALSMLPVTLPLSLHASEEYHFLFVLEPAECLSQSMARLRDDVLAATDASEVAVGAVDGRLLTTCVVRWRSEHASTAITSQYDVSWPLSFHTQRSTSAVSFDSANSSSRSIVPPAITLSRPPSVQLHSVFAVVVALHNTSHAALTCTLRLPSDDIQLTASHSQLPSLVRARSELASGQATPANANLLSPIDGGSDQPTNAPPFSPVDGFHFPFHSLAARLPLPLAADRRSSAKLNGHSHTKQFTPATPAGDKQSSDADEDRQGAQQGVVCLDGEIEVGLLAAGGRCSVALQCVAVRCGFVQLPRLLLHVQELAACYVCSHDGVLLVEGGG